VTVADSAATQVSLGYDHAMTESTTLFASYTSIANGANSGAGFTNLGSTAGGGATANGDTATAMSIGMRHSF